MTDEEIGALVTFAVWAWAFRWAVRHLGLARALWLVGILFFVAIRVMFGFVRAFRAH